MEGERGGEEWGKKSNGNGNGKGISQATRLPKIPDNYYLTAGGGGGAKGRGRGAKGRGMGGGGKGEGGKWARGKGRMDE